MNRLLNKPLKAFTVYALLVLMCSIPAYYYIIDYIWLKELDEHNQLVRERVEKGLNKVSISDKELSRSIQLWNRIQPGTILQSANHSDVKADSTYIVMRRNEHADKIDINRFRGLSAYVLVNNKPYHLTVETNVEETHETVVAISIITFLFFILLIGGFIILNRKISKQIWKPFHNTLNKLKSFDLNSQDNIYFDKSGVQEFEELNNTLKILIEKNISVFTQQKEFTENASHELQTPLAIIKTRLDLLLQNNSLTQEQSEIIESLQIPISRVSRINKNLLLLSKIENQQFSQEEHVDLSRLLNDSLDFLADHLENKNICIEKHIVEDVSIKTNKSLVEILLTNLLLNAIRHNSINGQIEIELTTKELKIANSGEKELNRNSLYKRFISSSTQTPSSGLGLAIVKEICNRYNWQISYDFHESYHIFSVRF